MPAGADYTQSTPVMICSSAPDIINCSSNVLVKVSIRLYDYPMVIFVYVSIVFNRKKL